MAHDSTWHATHAHAYSCSFHSHGQNFVVMQLHAAYRSVTLPTLGELRSYLATRHSATSPQPVWNPRWKSGKSLKFILIWWMKLDEVTKYDEVWWPWPSTIQDALPWVQQWSPRLPPQLRRVWLSSHPGPAEFSRKEGTSMDFDLKLNKDNKNCQEMKDL